MDEKKPPEITKDLGFLAVNDRTEFVRLFEDCLITRRYGMEQRMDHGRALADMRVFMKDRSHPNWGFSFDTVCEWLDYSPDDARRRIARTQTWDIIRDYLETNGSDIEMPSMDAHIDALFPVEREQRGPAWMQFYTAAKGRVPITARNIRAWVENYKALPVESEKVDEPEDIDFDEEGDDEPDVSKEEVPRGTKPAVAAEVKGKGPEFKAPEKVLEAIEKIARACAGDNKERLAEWRALLSDSIKIDFQDVLAWAENDEDDIRRISALMAGDLRKGLRAAMRIVKGVIDAKTTLNFLINRCRAEGGRLEHDYGPYSIKVTYHKERDYES